MLLKSKYTQHLIVKLANLSVFGKFAVFEFHRIDTLFDRTFSDDVISVVPFKDPVVMMLADLEVDGDGDEDVREDLQSLPELTDLEQRIDCHGVAIA